jgi:hypothetical protein
MTPTSLNTKLSSAELCLNRSSYHSGCNGVCVYRETVVLCVSYDIYGEENYW